MARVGINNMVECRKLIVTFYVILDIGSRKVLAVDDRVGTHNRWLTNASMGLESIPPNVRGC